MGEPDHPSPPLTRVDVPYRERGVLHCTAWTHTLRELAHRVR